MKLFELFEFKGDIRNIFFLFILWNLMKTINRGFYTRFTNICNYIDSKFFLEFGFSWIGNIFFRGFCFEESVACCIVICWFMQKYTHIYIYWILTDAMITDAWQTTDARRKDARRKTQEDFFRKIFTSQFIARVRKGCWRFACERMLETEHKLHILTPLLWPSRCVFLVLLDAQPEVLGSTP